MPRAGTQMRAFAQAVEAAGFDVLAFPDHLVPSVSPFAGATAAAMATQRLHTGTLVLNNDFRHPVDTAREAAGVATLAEGRFELGLGAGHRRSEYDAAGITFDSGATRVARLIESAHLIRALLDAEPVDFDGQHYRVHAEAGSLVAPPKVRVPLLVGGNGTEVLRLADASPTLSAWPGSATTATPPRSGSPTSTPTAWPTGSPWYVTRPAIASKPLSSTR